MNQAELNLRSKRVQRAIHYTYNAAATVLLHHSKGLYVGFDFR